MKMVFDMLDTMTHQVRKVQIYDTMQESIDAEVTTPPSAIQRQGTDINSNDPRLNIPGTPDNLT